MLLYYEKYGHYAKNSYTNKKMKENENLVEEDGTQDKGVLMMANEGITLFLNIQKIKDGHVFFRDSTDMCLS